MQRKQFVRYSLHGFAALVGAMLLFLSLYGAASAAGSADKPAYVRIIHASPEAGAVDVFVDGKKTLTDYTFGTLTKYLPVPAGKHEVKVSPTGTGADKAVITQPLTVESSQYYTAAAIGTKKDGFAIQAFADDNKLNDMKDGKVRVYHLAPNVGPVKVAAGGKTLINDLYYKNASDYVEAPAGKYTFTVSSTNPSATVPVSATLEAGTINSIFAVGLYNGQPPLKFVTASEKGTAK